MIKTSSPDYESSLYYNYNSTDKVGIVLKGGAEEVVSKISLI